MGHAVDDTMKFMDKRTDQPDFGGWKRIEVMDLARIAAANLGFLDKWKGKYSEVMLVKTVETALLGRVEKSMWEDAKRKATAAPSKDDLLGEKAVQDAEAKYPSG